MLIGLFPLFGVWLSISELENRDFATVFFVIGIILNFNRPLTYIRSRMSDVIGTIRLRKLSHSYVSTIEEQKEQAERELYEQKRKVEDDLRRQKAEAEQDIQRQRREAEEAIKREAENLKRQAERDYQEYREWRQQQAKNKQQEEPSKRSSQSNTSDDVWHLDPLDFADACTILGLSQGKLLKEYEKAHKKLMHKYHADKLRHLSDEERREKEEKAKILNVAIMTIRKKLR